MKVKHLFVFILIAIISCTEPYPLQTENFENLLVVEATITNEFKKQTVKLSRTIPVGEVDEVIEKGAIVKITTNTGLEFNFSEENNTYVSDLEFKIEPNIIYTLQIKTSNGNSYISTSEVSPSTTEIENVKSIQEIKDNVVGVAIKVDSYDATNSANFYRYEFEETYKIIAPYWSPNKVSIGSDGALIVSPRTSETKICYSTVPSNIINVLSTEDQNEDRVSNYSVHFLAKENPKIANRYSILVKQYIQSAGAHKFYKTLKSFSSSDNLLSQVQPGFVIGNIKNNVNPNEKVVGYFDVCTVSEKRIFFNFNDIFPSEISSSYFYECGIKYFRSDIFRLPPQDTFYSGARPELITYIRNNQLVYFYGFDGEDFEMVTPECGDCTSFSSNIEPDFWQ